MTGTWLGYYLYDNESLQKASGFNKTFFTITINSSDEKKFRAFVIDDMKSGGMEGIGEIIGEIEGEKISFKKFMPKKSMIYLNGEKKT